MKLFSNSVLLQPQNTRKQLNIILTK